VFIVAAAVVANPFSAIIDVGRVGMAGLIAEVSSLIAAIIVASGVTSIVSGIAMVISPAAVGGLLVIVAVIGRRSAGRRGMLSTILAAVFVLLQGECRYTQYQQCR